MMIRLIWFESCEPGTAAGQHLNGTLQRLEELGIRASQIVGVSSPGAKGLRSRVARLMKLQFLGTRATGRDVLLLVRWHPAALPVLWLQRLRRGKAVLFVQGNIADLHATYPLTRFLPFTSLLVRQSLSSATVHIVPNIGILEWITEEVGARVSKASVIENGFDGDAIAEIDSLSEREYSELNVVPGCYAVFVGKFASWQGVRTILEAVGSSQWPQDLPLVFVGDGTELAAVLKARESNTLVRYAGRVSPEKALAWTAGAAMALATRHSGPASDRGVSPYKVLEASGLGTPLIATRVKGQQELIENLGSGVLIEPDSSEQLAGAVAKLWRDGDLRQRLSQSGALGARDYAWRARSEELGRALGQAGSNFPEIVRGTEV